MHPCLQVLAGAVEVAHLEFAQALQGPYWARFWRESDEVSEGGLRFRKAVLSVEKIAQPQPSFAPGSAQANSLAVEPYSFCHSVRNARAICLSRNFVKALLWGRCRCRNA